MISPFSKTVRRVIGSLVVMALSFSPSVIASGVAYATGKVVAVKHSNVKIDFGKGHIQWCPNNSVLKQDRDLIRDGKTIRVAIKMADLNDKHAMSSDVCKVSWK